jgi:ComF family protein
MWGFFDVFEALLDAIIPPRARSARTKSRRIDEIPLSPTVHQLLGAQITTLMEYRNAATQDLIRALKYDASRTAATMAAEVLAEYLREEIAEQVLYSTKAHLIVPLPLHKARARERGFNQIEIVLSHLPQEFRDGSIATLAPHALARTRATPPQTRLSRAERIKNVAGAFAVPDPDLVRNAHIFLIDDVATTGATLINAGKPLEAIGAEVSLIALARA